MTRLSRESVYERGIKLEEYGVKVLRPGLKRALRLLLAEFPENPSYTEALDGYQALNWIGFHDEIFASWLSAGSAIIRAAFDEAQAQIDQASKDQAQDLLRLWAGQFASQFSQNITNSSRDALGLLLSQALREVKYPLHIVKDIVPLIGLNTRQMRSLIRARGKMLESGVAPSTVRRSIDALARKKIRERAETIARTETNRARNAATQRFIMRQRAQGIIPRNIMKQWMIAGSNVCRVCTDAHQKGPIPITAPFETLNGPLMHPPGHPRCRCSTALVYPEDAQN